MMEMDGCIFCPCDQPLLTRASLRKLRNAFSFEEKEILRLAYEDKQGTPILFDKKYFAESEKELYDIDTKEDLAKLEEMSADD